MSKLLERAKNNLATARFCYEQAKINDSFLDNCCFDIQQCIEFTLKYIVELSGVSYAKNHDIRAQLNILRELNLQIPREKDLRNMASTINSWEAESRYNDDFCALVEDIEDTFIIADEIIAYAENLVQEAESSSSI